MSILRAENISGFLRTVDGNGYFGHGSHNVLAAFSRLYPEYADKGVEYSTYSTDIVDISYNELLSYYKFGKISNEASPEPEYDEDEDFEDYDADEYSNEVLGDKLPNADDGKISAATQEIFDILKKEPSTTVRFRFHIQKNDEFEAKINKLGFKIIAAVINEFSDFTSYQKFIIASETEPFFLSVFQNNNEIPTVACISCGTTEAMKKYYDVSEITNVIREHIKVTHFKVNAAKKGATCHMIGINDMGSLQLYRLNKVVCDLDEELIKKSYPNVNEEKIADFFKNSNPKGKLLLFHGIPGSGKTTYIRHLLSNVYEGKVVFVNAEIFSKLTSASFIPFAIQNLQRSLLLIEDAEQLLVSRGQDHTDRNSSVADLLNYTDGLLGDALNLKVLATFNTSVQEIDSALLRKGRLNHREEFSYLNKEQAEALYKHLTGDDKKLEENQYSLADVYGLLPDE